MTAGNWFVVQMTGEDSPVRLHSDPRSLAAAQRLLAECRESYDEERFAILSGDECVVQGIE